MSKSLYQYSFNTEQREMIENLLVQSIRGARYKHTSAANTFVSGGGWVTAKKKLEYKFSGNILNICIWKVVAPIVPMWEMGCSDAKSTYGCALNSVLQSSVANIISQVNAQFPLVPLTLCHTVDDNFLSTLIG